MHQIWQWAHFERLTVEGWGVLSLHLCSDWLPAHHSQSGLLSTIWFHRHKDGRHICTSSRWTKMSFGVSLHCIKFKCIKSLIKTKQIGKITIIRTKMPETIFWFISHVFSANTEGLDLWVILRLTSRGQSWRFGSTFWSFHVVLFMRFQSMEKTMSNTNFVMWPLFLLATGPKCSVWSSLSNT